MRAPPSRRRQLWQTISALRAACGVDAGVYAQRHVGGAVQCSRDTAARALAVVAANRDQPWAKKKYEHGAHHLMLNAGVRYRGKWSSTTIYPSGFPTPSSANWGALNVQGTSRSPLNGSYDVRSSASSSQPTKQSTKVGMGSAVSHRQGQRLRPPRTGLDAQPLTDHVRVVPAQAETRSLAAALELFADVWVDAHGRLKRATSVATGGRLLRHIPNLVKKSLDDRLVKYVLDLGQPVGAGEQIPPPDVLGEDDAEKRRPLPTATQHVDTGQLLRSQRCLHHHTVSQVGTPHPPWWSDATRSHCRSFCGARVLEHMPVTVVHEPSFSRSTRR